MKAKNPLSLRYFFVLNLILSKFGINANTIKMQLFHKMRSEIIEDIVFNFVIKINLFKYGLTL